MEHGKINAQSYKWTNHTSSLSFISATVSSLTKLYALALFLVLLSSPCFLSQ